MSGQIDVFTKREYELSDLTVALERALKLIEAIKSSIDYAARVTDEVGGSTNCRPGRFITSAIEASDTRASEGPGDSNRSVRAVEQKPDAGPNSFNGVTMPNPSGLTDREQEVIRLIASGLSNANIAEELFISPNTVARHVAGIFSKTESENRVQAANYAREHRLLD